MDIPIALIVEGQFQNVVIPVEMLGELSERLREYGFCEVHFPNRTVVAEGFIVLGKRSKRKFIIFDGD